MNRGHYDEEELIELFERGEQSVARDPHVRACAECKDTIDSIALFADTLKAPDVWEGPELSPDPNPQVLATLRAAQQRMRSEDEEAEENVKQLLAGPRESWSPRLQEHPEWRTAGMVRKLIAATDRAIETSDPDAEEIAAIAMASAAGTDDVTRSLTAFENAYALIHVGRYGDALSALDVADEDLKNGPAASYVRGRINVLRANALRVLGRLDDAISCARSAASTFQRHGDVARHLAAQSVLALVYQSAGRYREAVELQTQIASNERCSAEWRAAALQNAALSYRELGDSSRATSFAARAIVAFEQLRMFSHALKAKWTLARIFMAQNKDDDALPLLMSIREEFQTARMNNDVALVSLDMAEILVRRHRDREVRELCGYALAYFRSEQLTDTHVAMTAVATLQEVASHRVVTAIDVVTVRDDLRSRLRVGQLQAFLD